MAYEPTNWKSGDVVTSAKLNKIEQGIAASGGMVVPIYSTTDNETFTCNMTFADILSAIQDGICIACNVDWVSDGDIVSAFNADANLEVISFSNVCYAPNNGNPLLYVLTIDHSSDGTINVDEIHVPLGNNK